MSSISASSLYNKTNADYQLRQIAQANANVFSQGIIQISDQQSRDKDYERGLEWIRSYIASLQAKLNTLIEELNVIYEQMLNELMYKKADTKNTAIIPNKYGTPSIDNCKPNLEITPYNKEVYNYQYNPFFASRAMELESFNQNRPNSSTVGRTYYDVSNTHHELGNSFFSTLGYLWMWDVDRVNASYATTIDRYVSLRGQGTANEREVLNVSINDPLYSRAENHLDPAIAATNSANKTGIFYDPDLDIKDIGAGVDPKVYQVNITALQPNRGVFAPGVTAKADEISYALYEGFENSGVLKSLNLYDPNTQSIAPYDDCKWTQVFINPYDRDLNKMSEHLQWRIVNNRAKTGTGSVFFGDPTGTNYNYEFFLIKDHVENVYNGANLSNINSGAPLSSILGPGIGDDYIDALNGSGGNQYDDSELKAFDTYGIPKNYPDAAQPNINLGYYPTNAQDSNNNTIIQTISKNSNRNISIGNLSPSVSFSDRWTQYYVLDERDVQSITGMTDGSLSSRWRVMQETPVNGDSAFSGNYSYHFGIENFGGTNSGVAHYGTAVPTSGVPLPPAPSNQSVTMFWGDVESHWKILGKTIRWYQPKFEIRVKNENYGNVASQVSGWANDNGSMSFNLTNNTGASGLKRIYLHLKDTRGLFGGLLFTNYDGIGLNYTRDKVNPSNAQRTTQTSTVVSGITFDYGLDSTIFGLFDLIDPHDTWWGNGYIDSNGNTYANLYTLKNLAGPYANPSYAYDSQGSDDFVERQEGPLLNNNQDMIPGFQVYVSKPYVPEGYMVRSLDLRNMNVGIGNTFNQLELRYRENFETEIIGVNDGKKYDKRYAIQSAGNGAPMKIIGISGNEDIHGTAPGATKNQVDVAAQSSNGWQQRYFLLNTNWGTTDQKVGFYFNAGDQWLNDDHRGWNLDDIEVVARGKSKGELISPRIDLSQYQNAVVEFDSRFGTNTRGGNVDDGDKISVWYSTDDGVTWQLALGSNKSGQEKDVNANGLPGNQGWVSSRYDLNCVAGSPNVRIKFVFEADSDNNEGDGWNIDNVRVSGRKNAETDFYAYKQQLNSKFVTGGSYQNEVNNTNRPNISFDPRGTNIRGRYNEGNSSRVEITNTDFPSFSNTLLTYIEQDAATYNTNKVDSYATWGAPNPPTMVAELDPTSPNGLKLTVTKNTIFYKDSMGRLINSDNQMYVDRAMAINLGLVTDIKPTKKQVNNKLTGWVNYDPSVDGMPYVDGTCFEEGTTVPGGANTYEFMTTFVKKTIGLTVAQASGPKTITINAKTDAYLYINGQQIPPGVSNTNGTTTYNIPSGVLKEGFNTIMLQHNYHLGSDGIDIVSSNIAGIGPLDETWSVRMYEGGFKGRDPNTLKSYALGQDPQSGVFSQELFDAEKLTYFGQEQEKLKSLVLNFKNTDGKGVGILSTIHEIELVSTGEPTIQSFETKEFTTSTINDNGPLNAVLNYGYIDGKLVMGDDPRGFNVAYKDNLNFTTDTDGFASITLSAKGGNSMVNDATILLKVHYFDDEDQDGVIDIDTDRDGVLSDTEIANGIALGKRKTKYIGAEDRRDTSYYTSATVGYSGTTASSLATGVYNRFAVVNSSGADVSYTSGGDKFLKTDKDNDYAYKVYNNLVTASKGRSGGANVDGNVNKFTEKLKAILDSQEYQEVLKYGLLDNIIIAATSNSSRGDQIVGKIILDWDWRRRRVKVTQGAFSAVYKS
ncbi:MAG: hypothetical protein KatS3mg068_1067 [Candidatus Sericytochromatia bacterium]|nr:MAG: hypothetical protein KatS3mg068_1067 [Candidatus Sericytochromatia bacterium]